MNKSTKPTTTNTHKTAQPRRRKIVTLPKANDNIVIKKGLHW